MAPEACSLLREAQEEVPEHVETDYPRGWGLSILHVLPEGIQTTSQGEELQKDLYEPEGEVPDSFPKASPAHIQAP